MDLDVFKEEIENEMGFPVGLRFKAIHRGRVTVERDDKTLVRAIYVELECTNFNHNFKKFLATHGRSATGFASGRRMIFWSNLDHVKSDKAKGILAKAYERQKNFIIDNARIHRWIAMFRQYEQRETASIYERNDPRHQIREISNNPSDTLHR